MDNEHGSQKTTVFIKEMNDFGTINEVYKCVT